MQVVPIHDHMDKLIAHDEGKDEPRDGKDNRFGKLLYEREHPGVPELVLSRGEMIKNPIRLENALSGSDYLPNCFK